MSIRKRTWGEGKVAWVADYRDQHGDRRMKTFRTKKDADAWLANAKGEVKAGTHTADSGSITVAEAADLWLGRCEADGLETATMTGYRSHVVHHIKPLIGADKLSRLTRPRIEAYVDELLATKRSRMQAQKVLGSLKSIIGEAMRRGLVAQNVAAAVRVKFAKRHAKKVTPPTPEKVRALLSDATGRRRAVLMVAVLAGLRASEIRGLRWQDVDLKVNLLRVRQRADTSGKIGSLKSEAGHRGIPMTPMLATALKEWRLASGGGDGLVFPGRKGKDRPMCHNTVLAMTGETTAHPLRHFYASALIDQGHNAKRIQYLVGHSSIQVTYDTYGHLFPAENDHEKLAAQDAFLFSAV